jgi:hypothetical protein
MQEVSSSLKSFSSAMLMVSRVCEQHDIGEEEWQAGLDLLAKEYLKGEGEIATIPGLQCKG